MKRLFQTFWLTSLFILCLSPLLPAVATGAPQESSDEYYGINFIAPYEPWLTIARESGAGIVRWQFNWRDHEPSPGQWTWESSEAPIQAWRSAGLQVNAILHYPPDWAIANPGPHGTAPFIFDALMPRGIRQPASSPDNGFAQFCYRFAERYRGQIASYEIWNEPDIDNFWDGNAADYFYLMKTCYMGIRAADPTTPIAMASMVLAIEPEFFPTVVRMAAEDPAGPAHNHFFDMANIHMYGDPDLAYDLTLQAREVLERHGMGDKPIWITETNVALRGLGSAPSEPQWGFATEEEAGWFTLQVASSAHAASAEKLMFFRLADDGMDQSFGLVRNDGTPRPAYETLQVATSVLNNIVDAERETRDGVTINTLYRADGARIMVLYSKVGETKQIEIPARTEVATLYSAAGGYATITPNPAGNYNLTLLPARGRDFNQIEQYSVGGPPLMIIEFDETPPITSIQVQQQGNSAAVQWLGTDGETGTGIATYDVEVRQNGEDWHPWLTETTEQSGVFDLSDGGTFTFRVRATDQAGNIGEFVESSDAYLTSRLAVQVVNLRGQPVPETIITLEDGTQAATDDSGAVLIERSHAGDIAIRSVDGGVHGGTSPPAVTLRFNETTTETWQVVPESNLIPNGEFNTGSLGWIWNSPSDTDITEHNGDTTLQVTGTRRPWGAPSVSVTVTVPADATDAYLAFRYRLSDGDHVLRLRAISNQSAETLWYTDIYTPSFATAGIDLGHYAGQRVTLCFDLWGPKGVPESSFELDDVFLANVPNTTR